MLERDTLGVREVRLFGAAVRWAEAEAHRQQLQPTPENKRKVLGKALTLIRFPLMTIEEFAAGKQELIETVLTLISLCVLTLGMSCGLSLRSSPVQHSDRQRGGESFPSLHSQPKASCGVH